MRKVFLLFMTVVTMVSCSKNDSTTDSNQESCEIIKLTAESNDVVFTYNQSGKVTKIVDNSSTEDYKVIMDIEYSSTRISIKNTRYRGSSSTTDNSYYTLDNLGRIISNNHGTVYSYNSSGYLSQIETNDHIEQYSYLNGNLSVLAVQHGKYVFDVKYEYEANELYVPFILGSDMLGEIELQVFYNQGYLGKKTLNRIKSISDNGSVTRVSYEKDTEAKVTKVTMQANNYIERKSFEYNCQ